MSEGILSVTSFAKRSAARTLRVRLRDTAWQHRHVVHNWGNLQHQHPLTTEWKFQSCHAGSDSLVIGATRLAPLIESSEAGAGATLPIAHNTTGSFKASIPVASASIRQQTAIKIHLQTFPHLSRREASLKPKKHKQGPPLNLRSLLCCFTRHGTPSQLQLLEHITA